MPQTIDQFHHFYRWHVETIPIFMVKMALFCPLMCFWSCFTAHQEGKRYVLGYVEGRHMSFGCHVVENPYIWWQKHVNKTLLLEDFPQTHIHCVKKMDLTVPYSEFSKMGWYRWWTQSSNMEQHNFTVDLKHPPGLFLCSIPNIFVHRQSFIGQNQKPRPIFFSPYPSYVFPIFILESSRIQAQNFGNQNTGTALQI